MLKIRNGMLLGLLIVLVTVILPANAGAVVLNINSGTNSTVWFISGEASLVMNGFDLDTAGVARPAAIDKVSIEVNTPVPGASIDVLIYEDANGGSPSDARLVSQTQVDIRDAGVFTLTYPTPVVVNQRAVWIGFYLPVNFRFLADTSGSSVLTYWAWTTGSRFDVNNLASAQILGASDGSAPVNINLGGKARITAEITSTTGQTTTPAAPGGVQTANVPGDFFSIMRQYQYPACDTLFYDREDIDIGYNGSISSTCSIAWIGYNPPNPANYTQKQLLYEVTFYNDQGQVQTGELPLKITHCIRPNAADLDRAVIGVAYGSPRRWVIEPSLRFGDLVCAEIGRGGYLAYFVPVA